MNTLEQIKGMEKGKLLAPLTTFGMGGPADYFYELHEIMELPDLIEAAVSEGRPWVILGWGSNMIFSDKGFRGLVIHNLARRIELDGELVVADSGTLLSQIIQFALKNGLTGMEKLMGVPGTIGGAVRGNAGAFGLEITSLFEKALIYRPDTPSPRPSPPKGGEGGSLVEVGHQYFDFGYRHSKIKESGEIILKVWLKLKPGDTAAGVEEVRQTIVARAGKHPSGKSAGSFFKNPSGNSVGEGLSAGYLVDQCGFKGFHRGGAFISEKHANFLMNDGTATMKDVMELCEEIQKAVKAKFGIDLEREVQLVGEKGVV